MPKQFFIVGEYMHEVFRQGREGRMMEPIVPEVAALIALIYALLKKMETWELVAISGGMWCSTALVPLCVAIIYYKIIRNNSSVYYEIYKTEQLFYDDQRFCFSYTDFGTEELCTYNVGY